MFSKKGVTQSQRYRIFWCDLFSLKGKREMLFSLSRKKRMDNQKSYILNETNAPDRL